MKEVEISPEFCTSLQVVHELKQNLSFEIDMLNNATEKGRTILLSEITFGKHAYCKKVLERTYMTFFNQLRAEATEVLKDRFC